MAHRQSHCACGDQCQTECLRPQVAILTWSKFPIRRLLEIGFVWIVVIGFEVAKHWRHWIATVVGNGYGLCIAQLCKSLHVETIVALLDVAFRCRDVGPVREGLPDYKIYARIMACLREVVGNFESVFPSAKLAGDLGRKIIRLREENLRSKCLQECTPTLAG